MSDLIDRDALLAAYDRVHIGPPGGARRLILDAPTIEAVPVQHGHWIHRIDFFGDDTYVCSCCGEVWVLIESTPEANNMKCCPACMAVLDEPCEESEDDYAEDD